MTKFDKNINQNQIKSVKLKLMIHTIQTFIAWQPIVKSTITKKLN